VASSRIEFQVHTTTAKRWPVLLRDNGSWALYFNK